MATAQKSSKTIPLGKTGPDVLVNDNRRSRQITNRMRYRLNKRRNLWVNSIAKAKNPDKIKVLTAKIEAIDFAIATLEEV